MPAVVEEDADDAGEGKAEEEAAEESAECADEEGSGGGELDVEGAVDEPEGDGAGDHDGAAADKGEDRCKCGG